MSAPVNTSPHAPQDAAPQASSPLLSLFVCLLFFLELARSRLRSGGFLTQWLPAQQVTAPICASMVRSFIDVWSCETAVRKSPETANNMIVRIIFLIVLTVEILC